MLCFTLQTTTHTSRITLANTPSVHSKVCRSYSPYRLAYGIAFGLITIGRTVWNSPTPSLLRRPIAFERIVHVVDLPPSDGPTSMLPWRVSFDS